MATSEIIIQYVKDVSGTIDATRTRGNRSHGINVKKLLRGESITMRTMSCELESIQLEQVTELDCG